MCPSNSITCITPAFNEADRICNWLEHVCKWADEVVILDKCSTDNTIEIARSYGIEPISIPFSRAGHEDVVYNTENYIKSDWFVWSTPSECFTVKLIELFKHAVLFDNNETDIVYAPTKMYSFGVHSPQTPYGVAIHPRLVHKKRAKIQNLAHNPFQSNGYAKLIEYSDEVYVLHQTHPDFDKYIQRQLEYIDSEVKTTDDLLARASTAMAMSSRFDFEFLSSGNFDLRPYLGWKIYNLLTALACYDEIHSEKTKKIYHDNISQILNAWKHLPNKFLAKD